MNNLQATPHYLQFQTVATNYVNESRVAIVTSANEFISATNVTAANEAATRCARQISALGARLDNLYEFDAICTQTALGIFYNEAIFVALKDNALQRLYAQLTDLVLDAFDISGDNNSDQAMNDGSDDDFDLSMNDVQLSEFKQTIIKAQIEQVENNDNKVIVTVFQEFMSSLLGINQLHEQLHPKAKKLANGPTAGINQLCTLFSKGLYDPNIYSSLAPRIVYANEHTRQLFGDDWTFEENVVDAEDAPIDPSVERRRANIAAYNAHLNGYFELN